MKLHELQLLLSAASYAAEKHRHQRRKDLDKTPYINHPLAVATVLAADGDVADEELLAAALLHDTLEDTTASREDIESRFGRAVCELVLEVTDDKSLPKARRKELQVEHAAVISDRAKQLKIADKICNVRDIEADRPAEWDAQRKLEYLRWARRVVDRCRGVNAMLDRLFDQTIAETCRRLGFDSPTD